MTVHDLIKRLQEIQNKGMGSYDVCYLYEECQCLRPRMASVRDTIRKVSVADPADGEEIYLYQ